MIANNTPLTVGGLPFMAQNASKAWSLTDTTPNTLRFELRAGDVWEYDPATKNRSEIAGQTHYLPGEFITLSYDVLFEAGHANTAPWLVAGQFHQVENDGYSPPFEINFNGNDHMGVAVNYLKPDGSQAYHQLWTDHLPIVRGHEYAMQIEALFDKGQGDATLIVRRDGSEIVHYTGPMGFPTMTGVYWKEGLYRAASSVDEAAQYSGLAITAV